MSTAINNNPANISTLAVQKTFQLIKALNDNNALSLEDKMIAIAESLNDLNARVNGLETPESLPDILANSIDTQEIPKVGGCSVIKTGDGAPTVATDFIGQVYIDTTNSKMYFAKASGNSSNWVLPSTAVVTSWSSTPSNNNVPSEKLVKDSLDNKNAKVTGTSGNLAGFNNNGLLADSGISVSTSWSSSTGSDTKVASEKLVKSAVNDLITEIGNINAFEVVPLTTGDNPHPDVQNPSTKIIYLTKDSGSTATDPYTEWIYSNNTWEVIGETSMDLSGYKTKQSAVSDPTASGTGLTFISNITQNENGVISPSKKTIQDGTTSQKGVVQLEDSYSSTSTTKAATPNSVKSAYDLANSAIPSSSIATSWSSTTSDSKVPSEKLVKSSLDGKQNTLSFDGNYSSSNKVATVSTVTNAVSGLTTGVSGVKGSSETNYRTGNVSISKSNIGLDNVDNTSDATKKSNFTGTIAEGNTGFVTGGAVYTKFDSLANVASTGEYNSLSGKPTLTNDNITLNANETLYITIGTRINAGKMYGSFFTTLHIKGGATSSTWYNDSIEVIHCIGSGYAGECELTNHIISYSVKSDIEVSYYLNSSFLINIKLKNNTSTRLYIAVSASALDGSDDTGEYSPYKVLEITSSTTAQTQSGTVTNVWYNHAKVSEKIGKTNSATTGIDYTSLGNANTPVYLLNGEFKQCNTYSMPYEWVTEVPTNPVAGKIYLM